jgi:hypothetical protein
LARHPALDIATTLARMIPRKGLGSLPVTRREDMAMQLSDDMRPSNNSLTLTNGLTSVRRS